MRIVVLHVVCSIACTNIGLLLHYRVSVPVRNVYISFRISLRAMNYDYSHITFLAMKATQGQLPRPLARRGRADTVHHYIDHDPVV